MHATFASFCLVVSTVAAPQFEQQDLWTSGTDGYHTYRIPSILVTKSGTVLAFCEGRKSGRGDHGDLDLLMKRSTDGGRTWSPQLIVYEEGDAAKITIGNPCPVVDQSTGTIWLPFCRDNKHVLITSSDDDGKTWSKPRDVTNAVVQDDWVWVAAGPGVGIQLTTGKHKGRLVVPCDHRRTLADGSSEWNSHMMYSDDHGATWRIGKPIQAGGNECQVVERFDGSLLVNTRMQGHFQGLRGLAVSTDDGGETFTAIEHEKQLPCSKCQGSMIRLAANGDGELGPLLVSNPYPPHTADGQPSGSRVRLTLRTSDDDGVTWTAGKVLNAGPSAYSCLAQLPDGTILCLYEGGEKSAYEHLRLARFNREWLKADETVDKTSATGVVEADIVVYGGTSGGVVAAVQAVRMGKKAVLVEPGKHLGGMTSGGLSAVDIGDPRTVGGIAREYFTRLVARYGKELQWDQAFRAVGGGPATGGAYSIEPHVAEDVFNALIREAGVPVHLSARLASVKKDGPRIVEFTTESGLVVRGKMFIDATYEGDLMAKAGVSYTVSREGNAKYGETYNGIYYDEKYRPRTNHLTPGPHGRVPGGQGVWDRDFPLDPYVVPGDPSSGLLPLIEAGDPGTPGEPAPGVQAYCYRLCLTKNADRLPIAPPPDYDPQRYELVARFIAACQAIGDDVDLRWFSKHDPLPNDKWDFNTATFGGNLPGASWAWPEASYAEREQIAKQHENYHRGLLHFLATDDRVPSKVREEMQAFGLPRDEFTDNGGWPHQLYVREARRMVSDLVLTEHHTFGRVTASNSVSLGSYGTDTHEIRRIVKDGVVTREGKTAGGRDGAPPYPIGYAAIVPQAAECDNLYVTFALSASHTAFSSIRMEPVFMATSQSAATAASIAIDDGVPVQQVDYAKLRMRLDSDKQIVERQVAKADTAVDKETAKWEKQAAEDAKHDRTTIIYDGVTPNKMVCDTTLRQLPDGTWVLFFLAGGDTEPSPLNYTAVARSTDEGKTWSKAEPFDTTFPREGKTIGQGPTELMIENGECTLFFGTHSKHWNSDWRSWIMRSSDSGKTWTKPEPAPGRLKNRTFLRNHIVTRDGRIMVPFQHYIGPNDEQHLPPLERKFTNPRNGVIISRDGGRTWTEHGNIRITENDKYFGWAENNIVELSDGRIAMIIRADKLGGVLYYAESKDGGLTWPEFAVKSDIPNPGSKATLYGLGGDTVAILHNPNPAHRSPMALWISFDGMQTWPYRRVLQAESCDGPKGRMNYPDGFVSADKQYLHFAFDDNRRRAVYYGAKLPPLPVTVRAKPQATDRWVKETLSVVKPIARPANEPVLLKKPTPATEIDGRSYDVVVFGGTAGGAAAAVRAAREGCTVLLVQHNGHLGGMLTNGLGQWDALYGGPRAALFTELLTNIEGYYAGKYGLDSPDSQAAHYTHAHYPIGWCEPHVFEREINRLVAGEPKITLLYDHHPTALERDGAIIKSATFVEHHGAKTIRVTGRVFIDGSYEGDLLPLAQVPYRIGREARDEYGEPHAGKCFTNIAKGPAPKDAAEGRLNLRAYGSKQGTIDPTSPYSADGAVQAYNMRFCVTRDPANRVMLTEPPSGYDRIEYLSYERRYIGGGSGPNKKSHMNSPILPGENHAYPEADWPTRDKITARHTNFALGLIWFLQNDETIPEAKRDEFRQWGLPKDEFADNGHIPYEMYVREARRLVGRHVFKEQDNSLAPGLGRTPIMPDSVAVTDWYMDSHACTTESRPGYKYDGKLILTEESRPAQIPYRAMLSNEVDNLLVPVCLSATHIAWGAVRLEPVWMQTGEAAGFAAALSVKNDVTPGDLDPDLLLQTLVERKHYVSFFNDSNAADDHPATVAAQYFGTKGFFADYDARLDEPVTVAVANVWVDAAVQIPFQPVDPQALARLVAKAEASESEPMTIEQFRGQWKDLGSLLKPAPVLTRGRLLQVLWDFVKKEEKV